MLETLFTSQDLEKYADRHKQRQQIFAALIERAFANGSEHATISGYTSTQEQMLTAAIATSISPDILELSHCAHRAVVACVGLYFEEFPDNLVSSILSQSEGIVTKKPNPNTGERIFLAHDSNNWWPSPNYRIKYPLFCKVMPGNPLDVQEHLIHLEGRQMLQLADADNACPKRTMGVECQIKHAERGVIENTLDTFHQLRRLGVPPATKTVLASTWVPCPECFELISERRDVYGESIDVISLYGALDDEQDEKMAEVIRQKLDDNGLGRLLGPYIKITKNPGYGWYPARRETAAEIRELIFKKGADDIKPKHLLLKALDLIR